MLLQEEVRETITGCAINTLRIVSKVNNPVLNSLMISCGSILLIKHPILPLGPRLTTERARTLASLKLVPIMSILDKKLHMFQNMDMDDNWSMVLNVEQQVLDILLFES